MKYLVFHPHAYVFMTYAVFFALHGTPVAKAVFFASGNSRRSQTSSAVAGWPYFPISQHICSICALFGYILQHCSHLFPGTDGLLFRFPVSAWNSHSSQPPSLIQPRVLCRDSRKDSEKIVICCLPAGTNPTATSLTIPGTS